MITAQNDDGRELKKNTKRKRIWCSLSARSSKEYGVTCIKSRSTTESPSFPRFMVNASICEIEEKRVYTKNCFRICAVINAGIK